MGIVDEIVEVVVSTTGGIVELVGIVVVGGLVVVALSSYGILSGAIERTEPLPGIEQLDDTRPITMKNLVDRRDKCFIFCLPEIQRQIWRRP